MWAFWHKVPNQITAVRLLLLPVLWVLALNGQSFAIGVGLVICGLSDWLDGLVARRLNQTSAMGAKLDSLADNMLLVSTVAWVLMLRPGLFQESPPAVIFALTLYLLSIVAGFAKFGRVANLHLTLAKINGLVLYIIVIITFLMAQYSPFIFWLGWLLSVLAATEALIILLISPQVDENMGSLLNVLRRRRSQKSKDREVVQVS